MHIQSILVALAILPWLNVGGPQQSVVGDACQGATALPVGDQAFSEDVLPNTLNYQTLCFSRPWHPLRSVLELLQRRIREADGEFINTGHYHIERRQGLEPKPAKARATGIGHVETDLSQNTGMVDRKKPVAVLLRRQPDRALRGRRALSPPPLGLAMRPAKPILKGDLVALLSCHEGLGRLPGHRLTLFGEKGAEAEVLLLNN